MAVIEKHLHEHFAKLAEGGGTEEPLADNNTAPTETSSLRAPQTSGPPFARVNSVVSGSPADSAGLKAGDVIRHFGYVNIGNHDNLRRVSECVQGNEGVSYSSNAQLHKS
jgi:26S proteasome non-ATPase regulatory subunit 9